MASGLSTLRWPGFRKTKALFELEYEVYLSGCNRPSQVVFTLVSLVFSVDALDWSSPSDHVETFAGQMSISRGEWQDRKLIVSIFL